MPRCREQQGPHSSGTRLVETLALVLRVELRWGEELSSRSHALARDLPCALGSRGVVSTLLARTTPVLELLVLVSSGSQSRACKLASDLTGQLCKLRDLLRGESP